MVQSILQLHERNRFTGTSPNSRRASALITVLAALGFANQLLNNFKLPFPLHVLLLPVTMLESALQLIITTA
jgi:hypothetical protein